MKGIKTTEFWIALVSIVAIVTLQILDKLTPEVLTLIAPAAAYIWSRTRVKQNGEVSATLEHLPERGSM